MAYGTPIHEKKFRDSHLLSDLNLREEGRNAGPRIDVQLLCQF